MAVPQYVQEIGGVKYAARIGETSSVVEDGGLLVMAGYTSLSGGGSGSRCCVNVCTTQWSSS